MDGSGSVTLLLLLLWMFEVSRQWKEDRRKEVNPLIYLALAQSLDLLYLQKRLSLALIYITILCDPLIYCCCIFKSAIP
jgi:hypothetical protein